MADASVWKDFFAAAALRVSSGGGGCLLLGISAGTSAVVTSVCLWVFQCEAKQVMKTRVIMKDEQ